MLCSACFLCNLHIKQHVERLIIACVFFETILVRFGQKQASLGNVYIFFFKCKRFPLKQRIYSLSGYRPENNTVD